MSFLLFRNSNFRDVKSASTQRWVTAPIAVMQKGDWLGLVSVLAIAIALRLMFYTGFFGSDEVTYVETAFKIASGDWRASNYIGATRYGMNLPVALSIYLFGLSQASANLWPFLCSVGEVATVFVIARWVWSTRVAVVSAGLLAILPLHVHFAGRMMADPPLAFFLTLSVALLLAAANTKRSMTYFVAGLAWGGVFWVKESVAILYLPVFAILVVLVDRINSRWLWIFVGMGLAVAANCALMFIVADNPMHVFTVMRTAVKKIGGLAVESSPWFYIRYLFFDIKHTFLIGFLFAAGTILFGFGFARHKDAVYRTQFIVLWAFLMLGMFSLAVVSFSPIKLVMKQTNYMLIFLGPMVLIAGWFLASLPRRIFIPLSVFVACGSVVLAALEQQAITVFTANSKAAYAFVRDHPGSYLIGTTNNQRAVNFYSMFENRWELRDRVFSFNEMASLIGSTSENTLKNRVTGDNVFAVLDLQNVNWGERPGAIRRLSDVPKCWLYMEKLTPAALGNGRWISQGLVAAVALLPESQHQRFLSILQPVSMPNPAYLFRVEDSCLTGPLG